MANPPLTPPITPRPGIMDIAAYVPGEAKLTGHAEPMQLAANENALGPPQSAIAAYNAVGASLHRYPEGAATALRNAIAEAQPIGGILYIGAANYASICCKRCSPNGKFGVRGIGLGHCGFRCFG